jgi:hypothetical protein
MTVGMLLGPQRLHPIVGEALEILKVDPRDGRKIAAITAGWQEREDEDAELCAALGNRSVNLMLHARGEAVFRDDPDFFAAHRAKQDRLRSLQDLYRLRLASTLKAARRVQQATAPRDLIESELEEALQALRLLDAHHVTKVRQIEEDFERRCGRCSASRSAASSPRSTPSSPTAAPWRSPAATSRCSTTACGCSTSAAASARPEVPIMAWSAGAMVVSERIVLFHDSPPQGRGNAEMLGPGLGLFPDVVVLPHARRRLLLSDHARISVFARRHATAACYALDDRNWIRFDGARWHSGPGTYQLCSDGQLVTSLTLWLAYSFGPRFGPNPGHPRLQIMKSAIQTFLSKGPPDEAAIAAFLAAHNTFPIIEGRQGTFVYHGPADAVNLRHWVFGLASSQPFERVEGTNLWHHTLEIPPQSRVEYKLEIVQADRRQWIQDPLNPNLAHDPFGANSVAHGKGYQRPTGPSPTPRPARARSRRCCSPRRRSADPAACPSTCPRDSARAAATPSSSSTTAATTSATPACKPSSTTSSTASRSPP